MWRAEGGFFASGGASIQEAEELLEPRDSKQQEQKSKTP